MSEAENKPSSTDIASTQDPAYARRLETLEAQGWKQRLDVQAPYRWNLRRLHPGYTLDIGCGIGRNLTHLEGKGVGVDHNLDCVATSRERGLTAYSPDEFLASADAKIAGFDSLLLAHVIEHLDAPTTDDLIATYAPYVREGGRIIVITPQEAGYRSDSTHVRFVDHAAIDLLLSKHGWSAANKQSFPFPRVVGRVFPYNEFVVVGERNPDA
ncbi:MAG: methyltransferase domain-containing protein [Actinomycetes bacterium]